MVGGATAERPQHFTRRNDYGRGKRGEHLPIAGDRSRFAGRAANGGADADLQQFGHRRAYADISAHRRRRLLANRFSDSEYVRGSGGVYAEIPPGQREYDSAEPERDGVTGRADLRDHPAAWHGVLHHGRDLDE